MDLEQHYAELLNLEPPWQVKGVTIDSEAKSIEIRLAWAAPEAPCPVCGQACPVQTETTEETWPYHKMIGFVTLIRTRARKAICVTHGIRRLAVPWAGAADESNPG